MTVSKKSGPTSLGLQSSRDGKNGGPTSFLSVPIPSSASRTRKDRSPFPISRGRKVESRSMPRRISRTITSGSRRAMRPSLFRGPKRRRESSYPFGKRSGRSDPWPKEGLVRSSLRCPFEGGAVGLSDTRPDHFSEKDARILERFAEAISLGYTRHLDFLSIERRNRELQIDRSVGKIQNAVQGMNSSSDLVRSSVARAELEELGLEYGSCAINIIDDGVKKVTTFTDGSDGLERHQLRRSGSIRSRYHRAARERGRTSHDDGYTRGGGSMRRPTISTDLENYHQRYPEER